MLERRRVRGDLIETFKILTGREKNQQERLLSAGRPETLFEGPYAEAVQVEMPHHNTSKQFQYESRG